MTKTDLCALWKELAEHPGDPEIADKARAHLMEFLSHADGCENCRAISEHMTDPDAVFAVLSESEVEPLSKEERAQLDAGHRAFDEGTTAIEDAVTTALLPSITAQPPATATPMQVFLATDAVNLLARGNAAEFRDVPIVLTAGGLFAGDQRAATRQEIVDSIAEHAGVSANMANDLLTWQLQVCNETTALYRGVNTLSLAEGVLFMTTPSKPAEELADQWSTIKSVPVEIHSEVGASLPQELVEAVEAAGSLLSSDAAVFEQVGRTLAKAEPELGQTLLVQSEQDQREKAEFDRVLREFNKQISKGIAVGPVKTAAADPHTSGLIPDPTAVRSKFGYWMLKRARQRVSKRQRLYQEIATYTAEGKVNVKPLQSFAKMGLKRAKYDLQILKSIKVNAKYLD